MVAAAGSRSHLFTVSLSSNGKHMMLSTEAAGQDRGLNQQHGRTHGWKESVGAESESHSQKHTESAAEDIFRCSTAL